MEGPSKQKNILVALGAYFIWGSMPLYWYLFSDVDAMVTLSMRILFAAAFAVIVLLCRGKLSEVWQTMRNPQLMKKLVPAALLVTGNWGLYVWALNNGFVLDTSLGYYLNPVMSFVLGIVLFKEVCGPTEWIAIGIALFGVAACALSFGTVPYVALSLAALFAAYGAVKKTVKLDAMVTIAVETLLIAPFTAAFLLCSDVGQAAIRALPPARLLLLTLAGPLTAVPLMMYASVVNKLPLSAMGLMQFLLPTMIGLTGIFVKGETFTKGQLLMFVCVIVALTVYMAGVIVRERKKTPRIAKFG